MRINFRWTPGTNVTDPVALDDRMNAYGSGHTGGANFAMGDGSIRFIRDSIAQVTLLAMGTRAGGEVINDAQ